MARMTKRAAIGSGILVLAVILAGAVYWIIGSAGNEEQASVCDGSAQKAAALQGLNIGQVAAFQIRNAPEAIGDFTFKDANGAETSLSAHLGQTVLLNLWATWCAPCREEMPALEALQKDLGGPSLQVLPVSVDLGESDKPKKFYEETGLEELPFRHDGSLGIFNELRKRSLAVGMPTTLLIDAKGCVLGLMNGPAHWNSEDAKKLIRAAIED